MTYSSDKVYELTKRSGLTRVIPTERFLHGIRD